jgi:hypothetical protein
MDLRSIVHGWGIVAACALAACDGNFTAAFSPPDRDPIPVHVETVSSERSRPALVVPGVVHLLFPPTHPPKKENGPPVLNTRGAVSSWNVGPA